ncbi:guanylate kinase [Romeria aff. gracilis LEGE 07310]|uniref:Guanylate kinase n=1 Tax=Vasconcelosia minhoensis LEGE 07310 TaxID=915328 RepID=A0A8J7A502_9CYAN|nr:guanylate kinase [Romeria aff. gracilis LEGE 07310]
MATLEPIAQPGKLIVFTGPSGVGKGTLLRRLLQLHPVLYLSISATTRQPRPHEIHGQHYYFVSRETFEQMIERSELLEWAEFAGNYYGTPRDPVVEAVEQGRWVILEIELAGARQIRDTFPLAQQIFVLPPSIEELETRIRRRAQDSESAIARRMARARVEIDAADEFDFQIVNDDLDQAISQLETALFVEMPAPAEMPIKTSLELSAEPGD